MKINKLFLFSGLIILILSSSCNKSESSHKESSDVLSEMTSPAAPKSRSANDVADNSMDMEEDAPEEQNMKVKEKKVDDGIGKPLNPITDLANQRLLEYHINLSFQVNNISEAREKLIKIAKINSILKNSNTNISESTEMLNAEIYTPVDKMYETILLLGNIGTLTNETVSTEDWTEHNQLQKIKTEREITRSKRRSKAASSGKAENWTWKDREELLERSEDNLDMAKMENWKIQDKIKWAKIRIYIHGGESGFKIHVPNYKNAFVSSINFFLNAIYVFLWILPFGVIIMILYFGIRWLRMRD